jgi:hypothetical protein
MPIVVWIENSVHERVERVLADESGALRGLADGASVARTTLGSVHPYADTRFNALQARWLAEEVRVLLESSGLTEDELSVLEVLLVAAERTERRRGYLVFVGD